MSDSIVWNASENLLKDSFAVMSDHESRFSWLDHTRGSVKFAEDDRALDSEEEEVSVFPVYENFQGTAIIIM